CRRAEDQHRRASTRPCSSSSAASSAGCSCSTVVATAAHPCSTRVGLRCRHSFLPRVRIESGGGRRVVDRSARGRKEELRLCPVEEGEAEGLASAPPPLLCLAAAAPPHPAVGPLLLCAGMDREGELRRRGRGRACIRRSPTAGEATCSGGGSKSQWRWR
ncbi:unnamed protein product, partial [Urochloa humidicola]